jgi:hypothetical protein
MKPIRSHIAAAALLVLPAATLLAPPASAAQQHAKVATPSIDSLAVRSSGGLDAGDRLRVVVQATPGARAAHVILGKSGVRIALQERSPGHYVGVHTIARKEHIDPRQRMTVRARYGQKVIAATVGFPKDLVARARAPEIERFVLNARGGIEPGQDIRFRLAGEPGGRASVHIPGVHERVQLRESQPGVYVGSYTVRRHDNPHAFERAVATLQEGHRHSTAQVVVRNDDGGRDHDRHAKRDLPLEVTNHADNAVVDPEGRLTIRGRTAPHAKVHVEVQAANPFTGMMGLQQPGSDKWVQADADGKFTARLPAQGLPIPGTRYDVQLRATHGSRSAEESLTLYQRQG